MDLEAYRKKLRDRAKTNREEFEGIYKDEIEALQGLSEEEIKSIAPDTSSAEIYQQLITVVQDASAKNNSQAELKSRITQLGNVAIEIARKVPTLASLFA